MKSILLLAICLMAYSSLYSQDSYYIRGNAKILNPKYHIISKAEQRVYDPFYEIKIRIKDSIHTFTPNQVSEYKHSNTGKIYKSEQLPETGKKVFMEVVEEGYLRLYFVTDKLYRNRFFIKKGKELIEINAEKKSQSNFQRVLTKNWDQCKKTKKLIKIAEFNRASLKRTIRAHNTCKEVYIPRLKLYIMGGITATIPEFKPGTGVNSLNREAIYRNYMYNFELNYTGAIGLSIPINQSNFSFETGIRAQAMKYNYASIFSRFSPFDTSFKTNISLLDFSVPFDIQYTSPNDKYRPFFRVGLSANYFLRNNVDIEQKLTNQSGMVTVLFADESLKDFGLGLNFAFGIQQQINKRNEVFLILGYNRRGATEKNRIYNFSTFYGMIGFAF